MFRDVKWNRSIRLFSFNDLEHSQYHNVQHLIRFQAAFGGPLEDEYGYEICSIRCTKLQENWWRACSICWTACEYARLPIQLLFRCVMELFTLCNLKAARRRFISLNIGVCVAHVQLCKLKCFEKLNENSLLIECASSASSRVATAQRHNLYVL